MYYKWLSLAPVVVDKLVREAGGAYAKGVSGLVDLNAPSAVSQLARLLLNFEDLRRFLKIASFGDIHARAPL